MGTATTKVDQAKKTQGLKVTKVTTAPQEEEVKASEVEGASEGEATDQPMHISSR